MPAKKYYVIWVGQKPGIYTTWAEAEKLVKGFPNAQFKSFPNLTLAEAAFAKKSGVSAKPARQQKPKGKAFPTDGCLPRTWILSAMVHAIPILAKQARASRFIKIGF